jgi:hypothetical protein
MDRDISVNERPCLVCQSVTDGFFKDGVDIVWITEVKRDGHSGFW